MSDIPSSKNLVFNLDVIAQHWRAFMEKETGKKHIIAHEGNRYVVKMAERRGPGHE